MNPGELDIFLVRHGEAASSWASSSDPGLSARGVLQAEQAAKQLQQWVGTKTQLVSSPLARARETAAPLALELDKPVQVNAAFSEVPSPVPLAERKNWLWKFMREGWNTQPESLLEWRAQGFQALVDLRGSTVVFTHFLFINAVVGQLLGRGEILCFKPDNGSITRLRHTGHCLELVEIGRQMETEVN